MAELTLLTQEGAVSFTVEPGTKLSDALQTHGHAPSMPCGGQGRCRKCRVKASGHLSPFSPEELQYLSPEEQSQGIRLACCTRILGDVEVTAVEAREVSQIRVSGVEQAVVRDPMFATLGAAVDVGTTTLALQVFDRDGLLASAAGPNPQRAFGADVISRVGRAMAGDGPALAQAVRQAIGGLLSEACSRAGRTTEEIDGLVITGNTAMLHLLTGEDPSPLAAAPFEARELFGKTVAARELDLPCAPDAKVYLPRCMSAFVGADITTALLASGICSQPDSALLIDIGTNGEIALWHQGELHCCSTAAGPAFEGANLSQGMQGAPGAIDRVWLEDGALRVHTIGGGTAEGICGSGVADALACLLRTEQLDETGCLEGGAAALTETVSLTQHDVRQVQLAKSAVRAGMETLLRHGGLQPEDVSQLAIAGGFGSYLSLDSAAAIGLISPELAPKSRVLGNAALSGAAMVLRSRGLQETCTAMASAARTADLSTDRVFMDLYVENMMFLD